MWNHGTFHVLGWIKEGYDLRHWIPKDGQTWFEVYTKWTAFVDKSIKYWDTHFHR